jgi:hypothetical protein
VAGLDVRDKGGDKPHPYEDVPGHVSVGRALRACPEDVGESSREHARSAGSTETNEGSARLEALGA